MPHFLLVASPEIKSKRQGDARTQISGHPGGKIRINAGAVRTCEGKLVAAGWRTSREADGLAVGVCAQTATARPARCPACSLVSWPGAKASLSSRRAFAGRPAAGPSASGPASAGSECRSRGCPQSPPARTARRLGGRNSRTWPLRRSPSGHTKASRRLGLHAGLGALPLQPPLQWA